MNIACYNFCTYYKQTYIQNRSKNEGTSFRSQHLTHTITWRQVPEKQFFSSMVAHSQEVFQFSQSSVSFKIGSISKCLQQHTYYNVFHYVYDKPKKHTKTHKPQSPPVLNVYSLLTVTIHHTRLLIVSMFMFQLNSYTINHRNVVDG